MKYGKFELYDGPVPDPFACRVCGVARDDGEIEYVCGICGSCVCSSACASKHPCSAWVGPDLTQWMDQAANHDSALLDVLHELLSRRRDAIAAAERILVPLPTPGTNEAKLLEAVVLLQNKLDALLQAIEMAKGLEE